MIYDMKYINHIILTQFNKALLNCVKISDGDII